MEHNQPGHTYNFGTLGKVYASLIFLAALMVGFSLLPLKNLPIDWNVIEPVRRAIILLIAFVMVGIVAGFLMGLKYEKSKLNTVIFVSNFAFLLIFLLFVMADIGFRGGMDPSFTKQINWESPVTKENAKAAAEGAAQEAPAP